MKNPKIRMVEALMQVCGTIARGSDRQMAAEASERQASLAKEHAKLLREEAQHQDHQQLALA